VHYEFIYFESQAVFVLIKQAWRRYLKDSNLSCR